MHSWLHECITGYVLPITMKAEYNQVVSFTMNFTRNILLFCNPIKQFNRNLYTWFFITILSRSFIKSFLLLLGSNVFNLLVEWNRYMCWNNFSYHKKDIQFINPGLTNFVWNIYIRNIRTIPAPNRKKHWII